MGRYQGSGLAKPDALSSSGVLGVACKALDLTVSLLGISIGSLDILAGWLNVLRLNWTINSTGFGGVLDFRLRPDEFVKGGC